MAKLHHVFQITMGWTDSHLHSFSVGKKRYSVPTSTFPTHDLDEAKITLAKALGADRAFRYEYDFGDGWSHDVIVEETLTSPFRLASAVCLAGQRSCPPEDCGGPFGYQHLLEALSDPDHPDFDDLTEWIGGYFDPEAFNLAAVNAGLQSLR
jgi:hypothetical protein